MKKILISIVKKYQLHISPKFGGRCLYYPTCSQYTVETLEKDPTWKAVPKITARILSCNPINGFIKYQKTDNI